MTKKKRVWAVAGSAAAVVCLCAAAFWIGRSSGVRSMVERVKEGNVPKVLTARVRTAPVRKGKIRRRIDAFGVVVAAPGGSRTVALGYSARIVKVMVRNGERVSKDAPLLVVDAAPQTRLAVEQARNGLKAAREQLDVVRRRFKLKLTDKTALIQAEENFSNANAALDNLLKQRAASVRTIRADSAGIAWGLSVKKGDLVSTGTPMLALVDAGALEARLGLEASDARHLRLHQRVAVSEVNAGKPDELTGRVRAVGGAVDPSSRLVDVYVSLPRSGRHLLGSYVRGELTAAASKGLLVPYAAVLPQGGKHVLFTVKKGRAVRHNVRVGINNGQEVEVSGKGLRPGDRVVVLGNYELKDGMAVTVEPAS